ncbi:phosphatidylglycerophosphatase A [Rickettsiales bacterium]|nr:phosphatidylglycerophosphatase A [Rickettsiales bacterium]
MNFIIKCFCTLFGVGYIRFAPGTFGSIASVLPLLLCPVSSSVLISGILISFIFGSIASSEYCRICGKHDASEIVIDEFCGVWLAILLSRWFLMGKIDILKGFKYLSGFSSNALLVICSLLLFRFFDIVKPFPIGFVDSKVKNGLGIMLDDVLAGLMSFVSLYLLLGLLSKFN